MPLARGCQHRDAAWAIQGDGPIRRVIVYMVNVLWRPTAGVYGRRVRYQSIQIGKARLSQLWVLERMRWIHLRYASLAR